MAAVIVIPLLVVAVVEVDKKVTVLVLLELLDKVMLVVMVVNPMTMAAAAEVLAKLVTQMEMVMEEMA